MCIKQRDVANHGAPGGLTFAWFRNVQSQPSTYAPDYASLIRVNYSSGLIVVLLIVVIESQAIYRGKGGQCSSRLRLAEP